MVDEKTIKETLTLLKITYPTALKDIDKETAMLMIKIWAKDFSNTNKELFLQAINNIRSRNKYFPSIPEVKEEIAKMQVKSVPEAEEEWQEVLNAVRRYGSYRQQEAMDSLKPYTAKIVGYIGFQRICMATSEEQIWNKKEFIEEYNALKDKAIEDLQMGLPSINAKLFIGFEEIDDE